MKLIDKNVIVAELEKRMQKHHRGYLVCLNDILSFLDTLEVKEVDLETELNGWRHNYFHGRRDKEASGEYLERDSQLSLAKHFFELGLQVTPNQDEWNKENIKPPFTITMDGNKYSNPMLCYDEFGNYCIAQYVKWHTGHYGWYDNEEEVSITHWKELKARKGD